MTAPVETDRAAWLVALDIDGTVLHPDGSISDAVIGQVRRLDAAGHQVMLAAGRSSADTIPVVEQLGTTPRFLVCSNGAVTLHRDSEAPNGYRREWVEVFDPTDGFGRSTPTWGTPASRSKTDTVATGAPNPSPTPRSGSTASTRKSSNSTSC